MDKRIGILTGGGDAPGLNAVIRAVVITAHRRYGWEVIGIREGFDGLLNKLPTLSLSENNVHDLLARGGTILGAANRGSPFARQMTKPDGTVEIVDVSHEALAQIKALGLDGLIVAGGDGTLAIALKLVEMGAPIVGVPKTIDNDVNGTDVSFGFDSAIHTATEALEKLQTTAESHHRIMVLEVMGREAGWIALVAGIAGGADAILIPEIPYNIEVVSQKIHDLETSGRRYSLVVAAEGAAPINGEQQFATLGDTRKENRLGGIGYTIGKLLAERTGTEVRVTVLGHLQRGGQPTPHDRYLATCFGVAAVHLVAQERWGYMVALRGTETISIPIEQSIQIKQVDPHSNLVQTARDLGIVLG